ncbi:uncharacterized protein METZ01_LOCUS178675, partial [marine metagenome]
YEIWNLKNCYETYLLATLTIE